MNGVTSRIARSLERADEVLASQRRWIFILLAAAFTLKLLYILQSAGALFVRVPVMDSQYYDETARRIAAGDLMQNEAFFMGPLYPYVLSLVYAVFGRDFMIVRLLQVLGGAVTVALTFAIGRRVFRPSAAFAAALMLMLYGAITFYEGLILMTWLGTLLNLVAIALLMRAGREEGGGGVWWHGAAGLALGLSALARANVLVFVPVAIAWIVWLPRRPNGRRRLLKAAAFTGAVVVALLPATLHNYSASHDFIPVTSNAGLNFFIGNNDVATGIFYPLPEIDFVRDPTSRSYIERLLGRDLSPAQVSSYWFDRAMSFVRAHPLDEAKLLVRKAAMFFNGYETPQIESFSFERGRYSMLRVLFVDFWWILALGLIGLAFSLRQWRRHFLLSGFLVVYSASIIIFFITARYRVQIAPILCLFAGHALVDVAPAFLRDARRAAALVGALALALLLTNPSLFAMNEKEVAFRQFVHDARRLASLGEHDRAVADIDEAIKLYPDFYEGYLQRAIIQKEGGDLLKAVEDYARALDHRSDLPTVHYDYAQTLRQLRMRSKAIEQYRQAIGLDSLMVEAWNNLGITYREEKHYNDAIEAFQKVIDLDPRYAKAYNNLGASLAESGRVSEAIVVFTRAITMFPEYANTYLNLAMAYVSVRRPVPAIDAVETYLRLRPDDDNAKDLLRKLRIAAAADSTSAR